MPRFYLIDDEPWALADMEALLRQFDIVDDVRTFMDGRRALEAIEKDPPDVIFTDLRMDCMNGRALIGAVREKGIKVPIVIISAHSDFEVAREALSFGVFDYLLKPVSRASLQKMMERLKNHLHVKATPAAPEQLRSEVAAAYPECRVLAFPGTDDERKRQILALSGACAVRVDSSVYQGMTIAYLSNPADQLPEAASALDASIGMSCPRRGFDDLNVMRQEAVMASHCGLRFVPGRRVSEIQAYLVLNYEQTLKLDELAARFYMNKTYLCEMFKKESGVTVVTFLRDIRMAMAAQQLRDTDKTIREIAAGVGYPDSAYFTRIFRSLYGKSPELYRRNSKK